MQHKIQDRAGASSSVVDATVPGEAEARCRRANRCGQSLTLFYMSLQFVTMAGRRGAGDPFTQRDGNGGWPELVRLLGQMQALSFGRYRHRAAILLSLCPASDATQTVGLGT